MPLDIDAIDLNRPASVSWFAGSQRQPRATLIGENRRFHSIGTAVCFVMRNLARKPHAAPLITTDAGHSFELEEIKRLHARLQGK
jgi:hypothetical protein